MISISRLLCDAVGPGDSLRYRTSPQNSRPVVVWNCTRQCNLHCFHCYADANIQPASPEMDTEDGKNFIQGLAHFGVPVLLFSGGEPLLRKDVLELATFAKKCGVGVVLSTNGTLITQEVASNIRAIGFREVGISLDGAEETNDMLRGKKYAYREALQGIRNCVALGQRVSLRFTITSFNYLEIPAIFDLAEKENVDRICFYHLAYSGRGKSLAQNDLSHSETRSVVDLICERTLDLYERGIEKEVLTVGNHADGVYIYLKLKREHPEKAGKVFSLLQMNGGNSSGIHIGAVDEQGNVYPDQFWRTHSLGNVRRSEFGHIWMNPSDPLMQKLRDRKKFLKGRCAGCKYVDLCNGNLRARAEAMFNDMWTHDPACYLTEEEIGSS